MRPVGQLDGSLRAFREDGKLYLNAEIKDSFTRKSSFVRTPELRPGTDAYFSAAQQLVDSQLEHALSNLLDHAQMTKFAKSQTNVSYSVRTGQFQIDWRKSAYSDPTTVQATGTVDGNQLALRSEVGNSRGEYQEDGDTTWIYGPRRPLDDDERQDLRTLLTSITHVGELSHLQVILDGTALESPVQRGRRRNPLRTALPSVPLVWGEGDAERLLDEALAAGDKVIIDTAYGPWGSKHLGKGNRKTTRGANFGPITLIENGAALLASAVTDITKRQLLIGESTLEQTLSMLVDQDRHPEQLAPLHVIVWYPRRHFDDDYTSARWRGTPVEQKVARARARIIKHAQTIATTGPAVGVHLVLIGDIAPELLTS